MIDAEWFSEAKLRTSGVEILGVLGVGGSSVVFDVKVGNEVFALKALLADWELPSYIRESPEIDGSGAAAKARFVRKVTRLVGDPTFGTMVPAYQALNDALYESLKQTRTRTLWTLRFPTFEARAAWMLVLGSSAFRERVRTVHRKGAPWWARRLARGGPVRRWGLDFRPERLHENPIYVWAGIVDVFDISLEAAFAVVRRSYGAFLHTRESALWRAQGWAIEAMLRACAIETRAIPFLDHCRNRYGLPLLGDVALA